MLLSAPLLLTSTGRSKCRSPKSCHLKIAHIIVLTFDHIDTKSIMAGKDSGQKNKKAVLSQRNRAMPHLFFSVRRQHSLVTTSLGVAKLRKPGFRAPNILAQNGI